MHKIFLFLTLLSTMLHAYATPSKTAAVPVEQSICAQEVKRHIAFKDPAIIEVVSVTRTMPQTIDYQGNKRQTATHVMKIRSKSAIGGYYGRKLYFCHLSDDEKSVLQIRAAEH